MLGTQKKPIELKLDIKLSKMIMKPTALTYTYLCHVRMFECDSMFVLVYVCMNASIYSNKYIYSIKVKKVNPFLNLLLIIIITVVSRYLCKKNYRKENQYSEYSSSFLNNFYGVENSFTRYAHNVFT